MHLLSVFFTTFSFCVIFVIKLHTVLINCFLQENGGGSEKSRLLGGSEKNQCGMVWKSGPADVTGTVRNDHCLPEHKLRVLFVTGQWHHPQCSAVNSRHVSTRCCRN